MESKEEINAQILALRSNADNLTNCLGSLLKRIEELEGSSLIISSNLLKNEDLYETSLDNGNETQSSVSNKFEKGSEVSLL